VGLALLPFAVSGNIPGQEILHPMAIVILGGLVTSTVLNLFIVPSLYLRFAPKGSEPPIVAGSAFPAMTPHEMIAAQHNGSSTSNLDTASSTKERSGSAPMTANQMTEVQHNGDSASSAEGRSGSAPMTPEQMTGAHHNGDSASSAEGPPGSGSASITANQMTGAQHNGDSTSSVQRREPDAV
jgi:hypothetical protein